MRRDSRTCTIQSGGVARVQHLKGDRNASGRVAHDSDLARVAAEQADVLVHPLHACALVPQSEVRHAGVLHLGPGEEAKYVESIY